MEVFLLNRQKITFYGYLQISLLWYVVENTQPLINSSSLQFYILIYGTNLYWLCFKHATSEVHTMHENNVCTFETGPAAAAAMFSFLK